MDWAFIGVVIAVVAFIAVFLFGDNIVFRLKAQLKGEREKRVNKSERTHMQDLLLLLSSAASLLDEALNLVPNSISVAAQDIEQVREKLLQARNKVNQAALSKMIATELRLRLESMVNPSPSPPSSHFDAALTSCLKLSSFVAQENSTAYSAKELTMLSGYIIQLKNKLQGIISNAS